DELFIISKENLVYEVLLNNQIIKEFVYTFRRNKSVEIIDNEDIEIIDNEKDNSIEIAI
ncbi:1391_t:CDS:1, partial [Dentiscutata heterogama]